MVAGSVIKECFAKEHSSPPIPVLGLVGEREYQTGVADFLLHHLSSGNAQNPIVSLKSAADPEGDEHFLRHAFGASIRDV